MYYLLLEVIEYTVASRFSQMYSMRNVDIYVQKLIIQIYSGITRGRVLIGELLYT